MAQKSLLSEDPTWTDILALPQMAQDDPKWLQSRKNKQSSSDFAAIVPMTKEYIGHIVEMWNYEEKGAFPYNPKKTCYTHSYSEYILKKAFPYKRDENDDLVAEDNDDGGFFGSAATDIGKRFEPIIRNITSQLCHSIISEVGWVEELRYFNAGVSPDGVLHCSVNQDSNGNKKLVNYFCTTGTAPSLAEDMGLSPGTKNFEAKTIVSREMIKKVPIHYHIQVERTAFELHLKSSIYTEARFLELSQIDWIEETKDLPHVVPIDEHSKYGILLHCTKKDSTTFHHWPHAYIKSPKEALWWRDVNIAILKNQHEGLRVTPVYFKLEELWCVEIPLWKDYAQVYGPLIQKEAAYISFLSRTEEGRLEYQSKFASKKKKTTRTKQSLQIQTDLERVPPISSF
jgi:hypothetical protein